MNQDAIKLAYDNGFKAGIRLNDSMKLGSRFLQMIIYIG